MSIKNSNEHKLLHTFIYGLKEKVRAEVQLRDPKTLEEASRLALDFDEFYGPRGSFQDTHHDSSTHHHHQPILLLGHNQWN